MLVSFHRERNRERWTEREMIGSFVRERERGIIGHSGRERGGLRDSRLLREKERYTETERC